MFLDTVTGIQKAEDKAFFTTMEKWNGFVAEAFEAISGENYDMDKVIASLSLYVESKYFSRSSSLPLLQLILHLLFPLPLLLYLPSRFPFASSFFISPPSTFHLFSSLSPEPSTSPSSNPFTLLKRRSSVDKNKASKATPLSKVLDSFIHVFIWAYHDKENSKNLSKKDANYLLQTAVDDVHSFLGV